MIAGGRRGAFAVGPIDAEGRPEQAGNLLGRRFVGGKGARRGAFRQRFHQRHPAGLFRRRQLNGLGHKVAGQTGRQEDGLFQFHN